MSFIVRDRTDDEDVRPFAYDIANTQANISGWHAARLAGSVGAAEGGRRAGADGLDGRRAARRGPRARPTAPCPAWRPRPSSTSCVPPTGVEAERLFLRLMIAHHEGGVAMADAAVADARTPEVQTLAGAISAAQTSEIALLQQLLADRS